MYKNINREAYIHDSLDIKYKSLRGAVSITAPVVFCLDIYAANDEVRGDREVYFVINPIDGIDAERFKMCLNGAVDGYLRYNVKMIFEKPGIFLYHFEVISSGERAYVGLSEERRAETQTDPKGWQLSVYIPLETPEWQKGGIMYHIFVDRFNSSIKYTPVVKENTVLRMDWGNTPEYLPDKDGKILNNDFFGGNLQGIIEKLDYLKSLNVTMIYLSPIFQAYSSHKYDTADYMAVDGMFGRGADFTELCKRTEELGISIVLDGVFNHTGRDSVYFRGENGAAKRMDSPYRDWYNFHEWPDRYNSWWGFETLPSLNANSEGVYAFFNGEDGVVERWLNAGARGWRLDVVDEINDKMLNGIVAAAKRARSDSLIIGEVWEDASNKISYGRRRGYFLGGQLDSVTNYPLRDAIIAFLRRGDKSALSRVMFDLNNNYPKHVLDGLMNILGTHDTERILTALNGEDLRNCPREVKARTRMTFEQLATAKKFLLLASVLQYTLPGFPCIYYGDEAGMQGYDDPFNRRCYPWGNEDATLLNHYRRLGEIRSGYSVFKEGYYREIHAPSDVYVFERVSAHSMNRSNSPEKVTVIINRSRDPFTYFTDAETELLTNSPVDSSIITAPFSAAILHRKPCKKHHIFPPIKIIEDF